MSRIFNRMACLGLCLQFVAFACCLGGRAIATNEPYVEEPKMSQLRELVLALDLSAADLAKMQGPAAIPELVELMHHEDNAVQIVALTALGEIMHPDAHGALMQAAQVADSSVAGTAVDLLVNLGSRIQAGQLVALLPTMQNDDARAQLILHFGNIGDEAVRQELHAYCEHNQSPRTALGCMAALAKLGLEHARRAFAEQLVADHSLKNIDLAQYIGQSWLLPYLGQLLRDETEVQYLGDLPPGFPTMLRVCDKAVVLIAAISGHQFSFPTNFHMNYNPAQIAEAAQVAGTIYRGY